MTERKSDNQHFVPQFYLRGWCPFPAKLKRKMKCVRAWNLRCGRIECPVSIKHECSRSGFYGPHESPTDNWLTAVETAISGHIWLFRGDPRRMPTEQEDSAIRVFMCTQIPRTRYCEMETQEMIERIGELFDDPGDRDAIRELTGTAKGLDMASEIPGLAMSLIYATSDLGLLVAINDTGREFITSDNPVVMANHAFPNHRNMGLGDAGLLVLLPIGPRSAVVFYDKAVYERRKVISCTPNDVHAMNLVQACNARNNLYYRDEQTDLTRICALADKHRADSAPYLVRAVPDNSNNGELLHFASRHSNPRVRFSFALPKQRFRRKFKKQRASPESEVRVPRRESLLEERPIRASGTGAESVRYRQVSKVELHQARSHQRACA